MVALMDRIMAEKINRALNFIDTACENFSHDFPQCCPFSDKKLDRHFCDFWNSVAKLIDCEQDASINDRNAYLPGPLWPEVDMNFSYFNPDLNFDERRAVSEEVVALAEEVAPSYYHSRRDYPEVNLGSFKGSLQGC